MRIKAKNPKLVSVIGEFMKVYLPCVKKRDGDTITSYRYSLNLYMTYLERRCFLNIRKEKTKSESVYDMTYLEQTLGITLATIDVSDFSQKNILAFPY